MPQTSIHPSHELTSSKEYLYTHYPTPGTLMTLSVTTQTALPSNTLCMTSSTRQPNRLLSEFELFTLHFRSLAPLEWDLYRKPYFLHNQVAVPPPHPAGQRPPPPLILSHQLSHLQRLLSLLLHVHTYPLTGHPNGT
jgi:hypothetical protein